MPFSPIPRRMFLRTAGVSIGLPLLDAMAPPLQAASAGDGETPKRMVLISRPLGLHAPYFFPETAGPDYKPSRYLKLLEPHRGDFTVFSGMSHHYRGGHGTGAGLFTGVHPDQLRTGTVLRNTISLDQEVAERLGSSTRFASLLLGGHGMVWNRKGVMIPTENRATHVFRRLFIDGTPAEIAKEVARIEHGKSVLDGVREQARSLNARLGAADRDRVELLMHSIREAEQRLQRDMQWVRKPKPKVDGKPFSNDYIGPTLIERERQFFDLVHLALQTDSTRVVSLNLYSHGPVAIGGKQIGHHEASHHGKKEESIKLLAKIEEAELNALGGFLDKLKTTNEGGRSLLDNTQVLYASDLGNASAHTTRNLPVLLAGGGFHHQGHVAFDRNDNERMSNLFVRMLQQMGIEMDRFGNSNKTLSQV